MRTCRLYLGSRRVRGADVVTPLLLQEKSEVVEELQRRAWCGLLFACLEVEDPAGGLLHSHDLELEQ
jgi:hypothetical protein